MQDKTCVCGQVGQGRRGEIRLVERDLAGSNFWAMLSVIASLAFALIMFY